MSYRAWSKPQCRFDRPGTLQLCIMMKSIVVASKWVNGKAVDNHSALGMPNGLESADVPNNMVASRYSGQPQCSSISYLTTLPAHVGGPQ